MSVGDVLFSFKGRIPRRTYWLWSLLSLFLISGLMVAIILGIGLKAAKDAKDAEPPPAPAATSALDSIKDLPATPAEAPATPETPETPDTSAPDGITKMPDINPVVLLPLGLLYILMLWTLFAIQAKRWHDRGKSGWMCLINLVPLLGIWTFVECGCMRGIFGPNQHGQDPT